MISLTMARKDRKEVMTITMPNNIRNQLKTLAKIDHRSESSMIHYLIEKYFFENKERIENINRE
jgi:predicted DNA-binding protein